MKKKSGGANSNNKLGKPPYITKSGGAKSWFLGGAGSIASPLVKFSQGLSPPKPPRDLHPWLYLLGFNIVCSSKTNYWQTMMTLFLSTGVRTLTLLWVGLLYSRANNRAACGKEWALKEITLSRLKDMVYVGYRHIIFFSWLQYWRTLYNYTR